MAVFAVCKYRAILIPLGDRAIVLMSNLWETSAGHLMEALANEGVSDRVKGEVMSCMTGLREEIAETTSTAKGQPT